MLKLKCTNQRYTFVRYLTITKRTATKQQVYSFITFSEGIRPPLNSVFIALQRRNRRKRGNNKITNKP